MDMYSETVQYVQRVTVYSVTVYSTYCAVTETCFFDFSADFDRFCWFTVRTAEYGSYAVQVYVLSVS